MGTKSLFYARSVLRFSGLLLAAVLGVNGYAAPVCAQQVQTGEAKVVVVSQLSFFKVEDLEFGDIVTGTAISVVRLLPNGTRSVTSGNAVLVGANHQPARFAGKGSFNQQVLISVSPTSINLVGPGAPMQVNNFEIGSTPTVILSGTPQRFFINNASGVFNFPVGATLRVNANQVQGLYSGTFTITLNYQ
jgi:Domain of unknown function (DUF4402)